MKNMCICRINKNIIILNLNLIYAIKSLFIVLDFFLEFLYSCFKVLVIQKIKNQCLRIIKMQFYWRELETLTTLFFEIIKNMLL